MGYAEAEAHLGALGIDAMKSTEPTLRRIEALCDALNNPEKTIPAVHVTGTNGKSSTARIATAVLAATGLKVATFTSPHLASVRERIALQGEPVTEQTFGEVFDHLQPYLEFTETGLGDHLTYFEVLTGMFFLWAAEQGVDAAVLEVGLGGRWDATNVVKSAVSVVTNIGLDHTQLLGSDRRSIAQEKVGIIKEDSVVVSAERDPGILNLIRQEADKQQASTSFIDRDWTLVEDRVAFGGRYFSVQSMAKDYEGLFVPLHGSHQATNAATAVETVRRFLPGQDLDQELVQEGLAQVVAPGRLEAIRSDGGRPTVVLDVAHNPDGISALVGALNEEFAFEKAVFVFGALADKDYVGMLRELERIPCSVIATQPTQQKAIAATDVSAAAQSLGLEATTAQSPASALAQAEELARPNDIICVTGSHYLVADVRPALLDSPR